MNNLSISNGYINDQNIYARNANKSRDVSIWESSETLIQIKRIYGKKLSEIEWEIFIGIGKATGLNPFLKEIWAVKYGNNEEAQIFIGRDGYRKSAQAHILYDYHFSDAVYENDIFDIENGNVKHKYILKDRGSLTGGYCIVSRKGSSRPSYVFVELKEYNTGKFLWSKDKKPATMIKKVAEAQCLRMSFQELFAGTYSEYEIFDREKTENKFKLANKGISGLERELNIAQDIKENSIISEDLEKFTPLEIQSKKIDEENFNSDTIIFLIENSYDEKQLREAMKNYKIITDLDEKKKIYSLYQKKQEELREKTH